MIDYANLSQRLAWGTDHDGVSFAYCGPLGIEVSRLEDNGLYAWGIYGQRKGSHERVKHLLKWGVTPTPTDAEWAAFRTASRILSMAEADNGE